MSEVLDIQSLDLEGRGVARRDGKVVFVEGALPGEKVRARITRRKSSFDTAVVEQILKASSQRVSPACPYFGVCGGCTMQHLDVDAQVAVKQRALEDTLWHIAKLRPAQVLAPVHGPAWGYRYRARLSIRVVHKKGGVLVGFRERKSNYVTDMIECRVLPPHVSALLAPLRRLIGAMSAPARIPQIEVAVGDQTTVLLMRHLEPLTAADIGLLRAFGQQHGISWWLQSKGPDSIHALNDDDRGALAYSLPEYGLRLAYQPNDFTQVNGAMNRTLVHRALALLEPKASDRVADLFCGLGNFTLPLAMRAGSVVGIEGSKVLADRGAQSAVRNGLGARVRFQAADLFVVDAHWLRGLGHFDRMLLDPPREGALALARALADLGPEERPEKIVYVSCNPATLARDAAILVHEAGYQLNSAGVVNMFPHTGHVESIAVFDRMAAPV